MPLVAPTYIQDINGIQYQLTCGDGGSPLITTLVTGQSAVSAIIVNDLSNLGVGWRLTIVPNPSPYPGASPGDLHIDPIARSGTASTNIPINSPDGGLWWIQISNGAMDTVPGTLQCLPAIGTLLYPNWNNIAWSQPGGPNSAVYPGPNDGSFGYPGDQLRMQESGQGLWVAGCQHWFDCWQIFSAYNSCADQDSALIVCPVCSYIQQTITPFSLIYDPIQYAIIIG